MYTEEQLSMSNVMVGAGAADDLAAVVGVHSYSFAIMEQVCVRRLYALISTLVASDTTEAVVDFKFRPDFGSTTGEVTLGQLTIPDASAVGDVVYKDISPYTLTPGGELVFETSVQAADAGVAAGEALYGVRSDLDPEDVNNQSQMVESA
jgi:hypothetical protein